MFGPLLNQLQQNIVWGQHDIFVKFRLIVPGVTKGWLTGVSQAFCRDAALTFVAPFFTNGLDVLADQITGGVVTPVVTDVLNPKDHVNLSIQLVGEMSVVILHGNIVQVNGEKRFMRNSTREC